MLAIATCILLSIVFAAAQPVNNGAGAAPAPAGAAPAPVGGAPPPAGGAPMDTVQAQVLETRGDFSQPMRQDARDMAKESSLLSGGQNLQGAVDSFKDKYDAKYGGGWNVFVYSKPYSFKTTFQTYIVLQVNQNVWFVGK